MAHILTFPVRFSEVDMMQVVYHTHYINWMEMGRTALYKELGFGLEETSDAGYVFPVKDIHIKFLAPAKYEDVVSVVTKIEKITNAKTVYHQQIVREDGVVLVEATVVIVCVDKSNFQLVRLNKVLPEVFEKYSNLIES